MVRFSDKKLKQKNKEFHPPESFSDIFILGKSRRPKKNKKKCLGMKSLLSLLPLRVVDNITPLESITFDQYRPHVSRHLLLFSYYKKTFHLAKR